MNGYTCSQPEQTFPLSYSTQLYFKSTDIITEIFKLDFNFNFKHALELLNILESSSFI